MANAERLMGGKFRRTSGRFGIRLGIFGLVLVVFAKPAARAENAFETFAGVVYATHDQQPLKADVYVPTSPGKHPGVLVVHGGAWMVGDRGQLAGIARGLAEHGYTSVAINYRLAPKYVFPAQLDDCEAALRWMRAECDRYKIDADHIGAFGYSAGGQLVALLGALDGRDATEEARLSDKKDKSNERSATKKDADRAALRLQAVVAGGAPCDFRPLEEDNRMLAYWLGGTRKEKPELYRLASPLAFVDGNAPPMFFFHGEKDNLVPVESPRAMVASMKKVGASCELYVVPETGHVRACHNPDALGRALEFLDANLKKR